MPAWTGSGCPALASPAPWPPGGLLWGGRHGAPLTVSFLCACSQVWPTRLGLWQVRGGLGSPAGGFESLGAGDASRLAHPVPSPLRLPQPCSVGVGLFRGVRQCQTGGGGTARTLEWALPHGPRVAAQRLDDGERACSQPSPCGRRRGTGRAGDFPDGCEVPAHRDPQAEAGHQTPERDPL